MRALVKLSQASEGDKEEILVNLEKLWNYWERWDTSPLAANFS